MQTQNPIFDQVAKAMTEAAGVADGMRREAETVMKSQLQKLLTEIDVVQREEFEAVQEMAANARMENDALKKRLDELEAIISKK